MKIKDDTSKVRAFEIMETLQEIKNTYLNSDVGLSSDKCSELTKKTNDCLESLNILLKESEKEPCYFNETYSLIQNADGDIVDIDEEYTRVILTIHKILLPNLRKNYNGDLSWTQDSSDKQRKDWSLYVIREMCKENNIELDDLIFLHKKDKEIVFNTLK